MTKPNNKREPLLPNEVPDGPQEKIGVNPFDFDGKKYLLMSDYFSKYLYVEEMRKTTAETTINKFRNIFSIEGVPQLPITDNGSPFNSTEFGHFCQQWNLQHFISSQNYP